MQANEKIKKLEEELKNEKQNVTKFGAMHQDALKETERVKNELDGKIEMIVKLNESIQNFENQLDQKVKTIQLLKKNIEDAQKQVENQKMVSEKKDAMLNQQIQLLNKNLAIAVKEEAERFEAYQREKKELEAKIKSMKDEKSQAKIESAEMADWQKESNGLSQLELLSKENQVLKEEIAQVNSKNKELATWFETALMEKHFINEQLVDAVDQLEIDFAEKAKLKSKLDSFNDKLTELNKLMNQEKHFSFKNYELVDALKNENISLKSENQKLEQSRIEIEQNLQKAVNEKQIVSAENDKCKACLQQMLKEFEKQNQDIKQIRKCLQNAQQNLKPKGDKQLDISKMLAIYQTIENEIDKIEKQSDLKLRGEHVSGIVTDSTVSTDYMAGLQRLKEEIAEKDMKLESLNLYLSKLLEYSEGEKVKQSPVMDEATLANLESRLERILIVEREMAELKVEKEELSKALDEEKKVNIELKEDLKIREEEYERQVKLTNELRAYLDESENSLYQIREEYKSLLRANEEHNKSMEQNINHKIFLENQIQMLEEKERTLEHQIEKLKHLVENKHDQEPNEPNQVTRVSSSLNQQVEALKNEKFILITDLEELKKEDLELLDLIKRDRIKCEEISINLGNARKRLNEILEIDKDKDYLNFLLEGQDAQVIKFKKEVVQKLLEQSRLVKAFEKVLQEISSMQSQIPEEPAECNFDFILQRLTQEIYVIKTKLEQYKKKFHNSVSTLFKRQVRVHFFELIKFDLIV